MTECSGLDALPPIDINAETLKAMAPMWHMSVHGDSFNSESGLWEWDLEFPDMNYASNFAACCEDDFLRIEIRKGDKVSSLYHTVTLTAVERKPR